MKAKEKGSNNGTLLSTNMWLICAIYMNCCPDTAEPVAGGKEFFKPHIAPRPQPQSLRLRSIAVG